MSFTFPLPPLSLTGVEGGTSRGILARGLGAMGEIEIRLMCSFDQFKGCVSRSALKFIQPRRAVGDRGCGENRGKSEAVVGPDLLAHVAEPGKSGHLTLQSSQVVDSEWL